MTHRDALTRTIAGALLTGASLLSGNAALTTVGGGIGINWTSEGLAMLWDNLRPPDPGSPLARAYARALRRALAELKDEYRRTRDDRSDDRAFALLAASADALAAGDVALPPPSAEAAQQTLADALPALLLGHDERQVAWLQAHLLPATARAFRQELEQDADARQLWSMGLIERIVRHTAALGSAAEKLPELLTALSTASAQLDAIQRSQATLEEALRDLRDRTSAGGTLYHRTSVAEDEGSEARVENWGEGSGPTTAPSRGTVYDQSAVARSGGKATTINRSSSEQE